MQRQRVSHHPCHRLSVPSAKRFWCRHCMMVFEDAITRWRHSRSCRSGGFDNQVRRREIETQSLQKMAETLDPEMVTQITVPGEDGSSKDLCCFICRQRFVSLDEMREHVKYPCNKPSSAPRHPIPLMYPEPTFGTGIQQHYTDSPMLQGYSRGAATAGAPSQASASTSTSSNNPHPVTVYMNEQGREPQEGEPKPTNIYVNENGETVIEVENLDLNTKSGELSLAHLLTQLSQQGIVFDQQPQGDTEIITQEAQVVQESPQEVDFSQPTAVDAANTLTQLAGGSAFRAVNNAQEQYVPPPVKRIKTEQVEMQYQVEEQPAQPEVQAYFQKDQPYVESPTEQKYIICTDESEVIRVVHANDVPQGESGAPVAFQNGDSQSSDVQNSFCEGEVQETVLSEGQTEPDSQATVLQEVEGVATENSLDESQMIVLQQAEQAQIAAEQAQIVVEQDQIVTEQGQIVTEQDQIVTEQAQIVAEQAQIVVEQGQIVTEQTQIVTEQDQIVVEQGQIVQARAEQSEDASSSRVIVEEQNPTLVEQQVDLRAEGGYAGQVEQMELGEGGRSCLVVPANTEEVSTTLASDSGAVTSLLQMSGGCTIPAAAAVVQDSQQAVVTEQPQPEPASLLLPQIVAVESTTDPDEAPQMVLQQQKSAE